MEHDKTIVIPPRTTEEARAFLRVLIDCVYEIFRDPEVHKESERVYRMTSRRYMK